MQDGAIAFRRFILILSLSALLDVAGPLRGATGDISKLRAQLDAAEKSEDKAAIVELSRRLVAIAPTDSNAWEKLASTQLELEDFDRCQASLEAWEKAVRPRPAAIDNIRGDLALARKDYKNAEQHWLAFIAKNPARDDATATYRALADLCVEQKRWREDLEFRTRVVFLRDTAANRVGRATALLRLHRWEEAFADMKKANTLDPSDETVKAWLPQFERLDKFLPKIKALSARLKPSPEDVDLLLERARCFTLAERPLLALEDGERAMQLRPTSMRARIQTGEALLDANRPDDAAKLLVSRNLRRAPDKHVSEDSLRELSASDTLVAQNPNDAEALAARAKTLRELSQYSLALAEARSAVALNDKSPAAQFEVARNLYELGQFKEALAQLRVATELDPNDALKWYWRGLAEAERTDFPTAIESQTRSLKLRETTQALRAREQYQRRIGKAKEADVDLARIRELEPKTP